ncbi:MAG: histidinol phosphatase [Clostridia bacterium]|nr:histidinol phosphatase [Clostridia bacterium]
MHLYETHLHTKPVSKCAVASVRETVEFYYGLGYAGIFITNHFLDGNINIDRSLPYDEKINFYFSDYEEAKRIGDEIGISVFFGAELSYGGTDFLVYGLDKEWFLNHPEIMNMSKTAELTLMANEGALIIQAHPFREASYIDHIRLYPRHVHGVEIYNANRTEFENDMAKHYAKSYDLLPFAGTDNHRGSSQTKLGGIKLYSKISDEQDFIMRIRDGEYKLFHKELGE